MSDLFHREKCEQRNIIAARRDGVNAFPVRLLRAPFGAEILMGNRVVSATGTLPADTDAALKQINSMLPDGCPQLAAEDVYVHLMEAANNSFVADRGMFIDRSTLRNISRDAAGGVAFMNSHRTGGMSHPSELPFGRTFAGRFEIKRGEDGSSSDRALIGMYMLRGHYPNGESGPSTDALHAAINGGTLFDVSVGLFGGSAICDVCGGDMEDYGACDHYPGTTYGMSPEEIDGQAARGVPGGVCSYTLCDSHLSEVSGVYDGAVPGAGFRKVLAGRKAGCLTEVHLSQARTVYAALLRERPEGKSLPHRLSPEVRNLSDFNEQVEERVEGIVERVLRRFGLRPQAEKLAPAVPDVLVATLGNTEDLSRANEALKLRETELAAERAARAADRRSHLEVVARGFADRMRLERRALPGESETIREEYLQKSLDDDRDPLAEGSRVARYEAALSARPAHSLTEELAPVSIPEGASVLVPAAKTGDQLPETATKLSDEALLEMTALGRVAKEKKAKK